MGITVEAFWGMTPRELNLAARAEGRRRKTEHRRDSWVAWHAAALQRVRTLPSLEQLIGEPRTEGNPEELQRRKDEHEEMVARMAAGRRVQSRPKTRVNA